MTLIAAADGSALGNPGPAGWAWYVDDDCWASGGWPHGTNNMGELTAVLDLLQQTAGLEDDLLVYCDSQYAIKSVTEWMPGWKRKGWRKRDGKPVQNVEIMKALDAAMQGRRVRFEWVKGHAGHELNEAADRLANAAAMAFRDGTPVAAGPGFRGADRSGHEFEVTRPAEEADLFSLMGDEQEEPPPEQVVIALERSMLHPDVRSDPSLIAAMLHPEWEGVGSSGRVWSRAELLAEVGPLPEETSLDVVSASRVADGVVLLVWRAVTDSGSRVRSSVWVESSGGIWRQRFHQGTPER